ncbi:MAG TPA: Rad52/Rad22 family DNA repair protein [Blastocatellia bacterium]|nr:Rad52/Rad22 family DNA repair protein [Blastocatellia bacterium]
MSAAVENSNLLINRAKTIAAMGMVERDYEGFNVVSPGVKKETYRVWKDEDGRVRCNCAEYEERIADEPRFRCEHILAVKFHLDPPDDAISTAGETIESQAQDDYAMSARDQNDDEAVVIPFAETLKELSQAVSPELVRQRVGWRDRAGREHEVDYVEWHVVADLLDRICPDWSHQVNSIKQIGDFVAVTASITIRGVTRQGIGTGSAYDEKGIKKAEHDALKRAAVKFGIARELYRREDEAAPQANGNGAAATKTDFPRDPVAKTMADLVTPKQLVAIRAIANANGVNAEKECVEVLKCRPEELSRRAASAFIDYLKSKAADVTEVRHAG